MRYSGILIALLLAIFIGCYADKIAEIQGLKVLASIPMDTSALEAERDAKITAILNPVKDEFESTTQYQKRKQEAGSQAETVRAEYNQKIDAIKANYAKRTSQINEHINKLLADTRENKELRFTIGAYDADSLTYSVFAEGKTINIKVPQTFAKGVKDNVATYKLTADRQLNANLEWEYANYQLSGALGSFTTSDNTFLSRNATNSSASIVPPELTAKVDFSESSGNQILDAEETAILTIALTNNGKGSAYLLEANISLTGSTEITYKNKVYFGEVKPSQTVSKTVELKASPELQDGNIEVKLAFSEQNGFPPDDKVITFAAKAVVPPLLTIADVGISDSNKNGKIEPGEAVEVTVRIQNKGFGIAKDVTAKLDRGKEVFLWGDDQKDTFSLDTLNPGEFKDITFNIITAKTATALPLTLSLSEARERYDLNDQPLNLAFNQVQRTADQMIITGKEQNVQIANAPSLSIDVEQNIPEVGKPAKNRYGVIFGIENYKNVSGVRFAKRDAEFMKEYFIKALGIPVENIYVRYDQDASLSEFKTVFDANGWLQKNTANKQAEVFFYYSGHGAPDINSKKAYLIPYDGNPNYPAQTGYDLETLYANLGKIDAAHVTIFLDSCFSGANRDNEIILADARPLFIKVAAPETAANCAVFAACSGTQISSAYSEEQHGLFSYFLMKGLQGAADTNKDKTLTLKELNDYIAENVSSTAFQLGREQNPQLQSGDPQRVLVTYP